MKTWLVPIRQFQIHSLVGLLDSQKMSEGSENHREHIDNKELGRQTAMRTDQAPSHPFSWTAEAFRMTPTQIVAQSQHLQSEHISVDVIAPVAKMISNASSCYPRVQDYNTRDMIVCSRGRKHTPTGKP